MNQNTIVLWIQSHIYYVWLNREHDLWDFLASTVIIQTSFYLSIHSSIHPSSTSYVPDILLSPKTLKKETRKPAIKACQHVDPGFATYQLCHLGQIPWTLSFSFLLCKMIIITVPYVIDLFCGLNNAYMYVA